MLDAAALRDSAAPLWAIEEAALLGAPDPTTLLAVLVSLDRDHRDGYPTTPVLALRAAAAGAGGAPGRQLLLMAALVAASHPRWVSVAGRLAGELESEDLLTADELDQLARWVLGQRALVAALPLAVLGGVRLEDDGPRLRAVLEPLPEGAPAQGDGYEPAVLRVDEVELDGAAEPHVDGEAGEDLVEGEQEVPVVPVLLEVPMGLHRWTAARLLARGRCTLPELLDECAALPRRERSHVLLGCLDAVSHLREQDQPLLDGECAASSKTVRDRWQKVRAPRSAPEPTDAGQEALF
ncbi:MAG TPA: hypothetical protein VFS29_07570 [Motilibacteraceae bacterium]|nr:hypothetical protein [Motilibacteraceae bacterium]